jgi:hypothetical protein
MEAAVSEKKRHLPQPRMKAITWKKHAPTDLQYYIEDSFKKITFYSTRGRMPTIKKNWQTEPIK